MSLYQSKFFFTSKKEGNLAFHVNDDKIKVIQNHQKLADFHSYNLEALVHMKQIHSDIVHIIDEKDNFENPPTCDALITDKKNTPLMVMVADCTPVLFFDDTKGVIAVAHVGRQGAFKNIVKNVLNSFVSEFNSRLENIKVKIGVSICKNCYEVGQEINQEAKSLNLSYAIEKIDDKFFLDVNKIILKQLRDYGITENNIELSSDCSSCNQDYYSYRRDGQTGRFAGVIVLV
jgi:YfiH family protein